MTGLLVAVIVGAILVLLFRLGMSDGKHGLFVSRARYDLLEHNSRELVGMLRAGLAVSDNRALTAETRLDAMTEKYHALATSLLPKTPVALVGAPAAPREKDIVVEKIREEAGGDPRLVAHFTKLAQQLKRDGKKPEEIVELIGWTTADPPEEKTAA